MHSDPKMKLGEKLGWYLIALTVIVGVILFATLIVFFAAGGIGPEEVLIAQGENGQWSVEVNCPLGIMTPDVTVVTAEKQANWWVREREILWIRMHSDSARINFLPMDSVKVDLWFRAQKRSYSLSLLAETTVKDTIDLKNKNRPE